MGTASRGAPSSPADVRASTRTGSRPDVGRGDTRSATLAGCTQRPDLGRRAAAAASRSGACPVLGRLAARGATRAYMGFACPCAIALRAPSRPILGAAQTRCSITCGAAPRAVLEPACGRCGAGRIHAGAGLELARGTVVGCAREPFEGAGPAIV